MALYHGGENDIKFVSSYPTLKDPSPTPKDVDLEEVFMGYPKISRAPFISFVVFKRISSILGSWLREQIHLNTWLSQVYINKILMKSIRSMRNTRLTTTHDNYIQQERRDFDCDLLVGMVHGFTTCEFTYMFKQKLLCS